MIKTVCRIGTEGLCMAATNKYYWSTIMISKLRHNHVWVTNKLFLCSPVFSAPDGDSATLHGNHWGEAAAEAA